MITTAEQSQQIKDIMKSLDRSDTIFCMHIDNYLRQFDLLRSEFIEAKWIILTDLYSKVIDGVNIWGLYEDPKAYCASIVSKYNRKYLGFMGVIIRRALPLYFGSILFMLLIFSPNGFSRLLYLDNPGIEISVNTLLRLSLMVFLYFSIRLFEYKMLFNKERRNLTFYFNAIIQVFILIVLTNNFTLINNLDQNMVTLNPMIMVILLGLILIYYIHNRKKLIL